MKRFRFFSVAVAVVAVLFVSVWAGQGSFISGTAMSIAGLPVGSSKNSNQVQYKISPTPANATITKVTWSPGTVTTNQGTIQTNSVTITYGSNSVTIPWTGSGTVSTTAFNNQPANGIFYVLYNGKCISGYTTVGQVVNQCNKTNTNTKITVDYTP